MKYNINPEATSLANLIRPKDWKFNEVRNLRASCFPQEMLNAYKRSYDKYYGKHKNKPKTLTLDYLCMKCLGKHYEPGMEIDMSFEEAECFFKDVSVGLRVGSGTCV